tara:strand:- start:344 stop:835 length:492 start_codon:yes stop_codon:yes gene_type:complete
VNASELFELLLADGGMREELKADAFAFAVRHSLDEEAIEFVEKLDWVGLNAQVNALIEKRFHECVVYMPLTARANENLAKEFTMFARSFWPEGHKRHRSDAVEFLKWLLQKSMPVERRELHWNQFQLHGKRCSVKLYRGLNGKPQVLFMYRKGNVSRYYWRGS